MIQSIGRPIPHDIRYKGETGRVLKTYEDILSISRQSKQPLTALEVLSHILKLSEIDISLKTIGNAFSCRLLSIGTTAVRIIEANKFPRGYIIQNPTNSIGITTTGTLGAVVTSAGADTTIGDLGVANFDNIHLFMDVTNSSGTVLRIDAKAQDPVSLNYAQTQLDIFSAQEVIGTYYAYLGALGIATSLRLTFTSTGTYSFTIGYALKDGLVGGASGINRNISLGGRDVNTSSGYTLLEGSTETWYLKENTELWAIASATTPLKVFELQ